MTQPLPGETPEVLDGPSLLPRKSWLGRRPMLASGGGAVLVAIAAVVLFATGAFRGQPAITVHGIQLVIADPIHGQNAQRAYPDVTDGTEVTIISPAGAVVGTATLVVDPGGTASALKMAVAGTPVQPAADLASFVAEYDFTATVPAGLARYGILVGQNRGTTWFTQQQMRRDPILTLGSLGG